MTEEGIVIREPVCFSCKHVGFWPTCEAFLGPIPMDIRQGENDHSQPIEGDHGMQYEPVEQPVNAQPD